MNVECKCFIMHTHIHIRLNTHTHNSCSSHLCFTFYQHLWFVHSFSLIHYLQPSLPTISLVQCAFGEGVCSPIRGFYGTTGSSVSYGVFISAVVSSYFLFLRQSLPPPPSPPPPYTTHGNCKTHKLVKLHFISF